MAAGTLLSRITGFARTAVLAYAVGVSGIAGAYGVASALPVVLLVLVTGGTLSAVLVPLLVETGAGDERRRRASDLSGLITMVTAAATVLGVALAPLLARLFAIGLDESATRDDYVRVTTLFVVLFAPQVLAYGVSVHATAVLNTDGRLGLAGFAPVLTNLVTIAGTLGYARLAGSARDDLQAVGTGPLLVLGASTTMGVVVMAAVQLAGARRCLPGLRVGPRRGLLREPVARMVLKLGKWSVVYVVANQIGLVTVLVAATSLAGGGGSAAYQWSFAIMQLPYAVIAVSVLSALYTRIARAALAADDSLGAQVAAGLRLLLLLLTPCALLLGLLSEPITGLLLGYGSVDDAGVALLSEAVRWFGLALLPFTWFQVLTRTCYARKDTRTPALVNIVLNSVTMVGALVAVQSSADDLVRMRTLVLGYAASYVVGSVVLQRALGASVPGLSSGLPRTVAVVAVLAGLEAAVVGVTRQPDAGDLVAVLVPGLALLGVHSLACGVLLRSRWSGLSTDDLRERPRP